jgi:hypothetical protein
VSARTSFSLLLPPLIDELGRLASQSEAGSWPSYWLSARLVAPEQTRSVQIVW